MLRSIVGVFHVSQNLASCPVYCIHKCKVDFCVFLKVSIGSLLVYIFFCVISYIKFCV